MQLSKTNPDLTINSRMRYVQNSPNLGCPELQARL